MKLAEALAERGDCQKRIEDLKKRLVRIARVQEGEKPAENPAELLGELDRIFVRFQDLIQVINRTNVRTPFREQTTLADALAERDALGKKRDLLEQVVEAASLRQDRYSKSEVKFVSTMEFSGARHTDSRVELEGGYRLR
ncbi:MAG TPA: DIP1984 family protein [Bryobacteraceae bacterium]|nr:DIP1984 family protein [Bryobacteraceae bacterium]